MTEMRRPVVNGLIELREEYHSDHHTLIDLKHQALEHVEDLLAVDKGIEGTSLTYTYTDGVAVRKLAVGYVDQGVSEDETIVYALDDRIVSVEFGRMPITTEVLVRTRLYKEGILREAAKVSIRQFVLGATHPIIARYEIDQYTGGAIQAVVARTDASRTQGLDEREMTPYDFLEFQKQLEIVAAMRAGMLVGGNRGEAA